MFGRSMSAAARVLRPVARRFSLHTRQQQNSFSWHPLAVKGLAAFGTVAALAALGQDLVADEDQERRDDQLKVKTLHDERRNRLQELIAKVNQDTNLLLFSGRANVELAQEVADYLGERLGNITVSRFADGEVKVQVNENVRGKDIYIFQPTCPPVNENLMELLLMVSTMRRASAKRITVIIPYYGYARQDRKMTARVPISAADVARLLESMGVDRVVAVDLHCGQIQGFFGPRVPVDNLDGGYVGVEYFGQKSTSNVSRSAVIQTCGIALTCFCVCVCRVVLSDIVCFSFGQSRNRVPRRRWRVQSEEIP